MTVEMRDKGDLVEPLALEDGQIAVFIRDNVCAACLGHLWQVPAPNRKWYAKCPEHGLIGKGGYVSKRRRDAYEQEVLAGLRELRRWK